MTKKKRQYLKTSIIARKNEEVLSNRAKKRKEKSEQMDDEA